MRVKQQSWLYLKGWWMVRCCYSPSIVVDLPAHLVAARQQLSLPLLQHPPDLLIRLTITCSPACNSYFWRLGGGEQPKQVPGCPWGFQLILKGSCLFLFLPPLLHSCSTMLSIHLLLHPPVILYCLPYWLQAQVQKKKAYVKSVTSSSNTVKSISIIKPVFLYYF